MAKNPFKPAEQISKKLKILIFGESGVGKTLAGLSFPRLAVIDTENGSDLYRGKFKFDVLSVNTIKEIEEALAFLKDDNGRTFSSLMIDSGTVAYNVLRSGYAERTADGELGYREHGSINRKMAAMHAKIMALPLHVIMTAHEAIEYEVIGKTLSKKGVKPDLDKRAAHTFDVVLRMTPDHKAQVVKSRGVVIGTKGLLPEVNWKVFEPIAEQFAAGKMAEVLDEEAGIKATAEALAKEQDREGQAVQYNAMIGRLIGSGIFKSMEEAKARAKEVQATIDFRANPEEFETAMRQRTAAPIEE